MSETITVVQVGAVGAAAAQASAATALQAKNDTLTAKGQVDTAKAAVDVAKTAVDTAKGQVDTAKAAVDVAKGQVDAAQSDVIARQAVVVAAQGATETARDTAIAQAGVATTKAADASGSAAAALAIFGSTEAMSLALAIMLGYVGTAQGQSSLAQTYASQAASVVQQDLSGVTNAKLHSSPNAITALPPPYDVSKDSDGGAWVDKCSQLSWPNEPLNGTWLPGGFASEMEARDYFGTLGAASVVTGDSSTFAAGVGAWTPVANGAVSVATAGKLKLAQTGALGTTMQCSLAIATTPGQRYQVSLDYVTATTSAQNLWWGVGTSAGGSQLAASASMGAAPIPRRMVSFVATGTTSYLWLGGTTSWATGVFAEVSNVLVKPVSFATNPSGGFYQSSADGKFYRFYKNLLRSSNLTTGTGWTFVNASGAATQVGNAYTFGASAVDRLTQGPSGLTLPVGAVLTASAKLSGSGNIRLYAFDGNGATTFTINVTLTGTPTWYSVPVTVANAGTQWGIGIYNNAAGTAGASFTVDGTQIEFGSALTAEEVKGGDGTQVETFRGNKAKFPRLSQIVVEAGNTTIYDLTEPGRPMWMRFVGVGSTQATSNMLGSVSIPNSSVCAVNGKIILGDTAGAGGYGLRVIDLAEDFAVAYRQTSLANVRYNGGIAQRNSALGWTPIGAVYPVNNTVNAVSACVMPDAPVSPLTGLQVPTIACFTAGGISILQNDGTMRNSSLTSSFTSGEITPRMMTARWASSSWYLAPNPGSLGASFSMTSVSGSQAPGFNGSQAASKVILPRRDLMVRYGGSSQLGLMRVNESTPAGSLVAWIDSTYNTGWWCGDIRRCWLADTVAGTADSTTNIVSNGDFAANITGWSPVISTLSWESGTIKILHANASNAGRAVSTNTPVTAGKAYRIRWDTVELLGDATGVAIQFGDVNGNVSAHAFGGTGSKSGVGSFDVPVTVALPGTSFLPGYVSIQVIGGTLAGGGGARVDNLIITEIVADRCYKAKPATIYGTLARTAVAAAAQQVFYSSWSAANYVQEAYSADLDPGTGSLAVRTWGTIPTNVAAAGWAFDRSSASGGAYYRLGHSATGQIVAELYDGTTTRTVTTTATYATGLPIEFGLEYVPNGASSTLTVKVNGRQAQQSTFAALGSLSNGTAVATLGIDRALTAPWAGGLALMKPGMTAASANASAWMYEQEKQMFRAGAQVTLPGGNSLVDVAYDEATDTLSVIDAANEAHFCGLARVSTAAVPAGAFSKVARGGGLKLLARSGANPGVDITVPSQNLREELANRELAAARRVRQMKVVHIDSVTGQVDFLGEVGWEFFAIDGAAGPKREGVAKDYALLYDGFQETARFVASPGIAWLRATMRRSA